MKYEDAKTTGEQLENLVIDIISGYGYVLHNLYIPCGNNNTTEVDVVLINSVGVFVFECKNYSGWIFGGYKQEYWTQCLPTHYGESNKIKFYNPISQNYTHIRNLRKIVGSNIPIYSIIVFGCNATFKTQMPNSDTLKVINVEELFDTMTLLSGKPCEINNVDSVYNKLLNYTNVSEVIKHKHVEFVNTIKHKPIGFVNTIADKTVDCHKVEPKTVEYHNAESETVQEQNECKKVKMQSENTKLNMPMNVNNTKNNNRKYYIIWLVILVLIIFLYLCCICGSFYHSI